MNEIEYLRERMKTDVVLFAYEKVDGTRREAYGTLNPDIIDSVLAQREASSPKRRSYSHKPNDAMFSYFDTEKADWRGFYKDRFLEINDDYGF